MTRPFNKWEEAFWKKRESDPQAGGFKKSKLGKPMCQPPLADGVLATGD